MKTKPLSIIALSLMLIASACSPFTITSSSSQQPTPVVETAPPTPVSTANSEVLMPEGWVTHTNTSQQCEYAISYPPELQVNDENLYSQTLGFKLANPEEGARNFVYLSVIGAEVQSMVEEGTYNNDVYNYDPTAAEILLNMEVGESKPVYEFPTVDSGFTYQRQSDTVISGQAAQTYENLQPWEFPAGTKEIRYYLSLNECTYLIGGYMDTAQSNQPGVITEELFNQIVATFRAMH